ncbi:hypothetical protein GGTG_13356 [Gaeumannomyces tritici R3-111a-1]|uniref:Myb/SANT-like domain-containing protein n=1 Tax=Gaeumannomyces tritici (strain R3-111a-1) TaxID=644352 RepID=J3PIM7_GAET3|nr:hypothetical protein GGTG_13356 [Gaeumannomyces tritici R3-111a-1]EJT69088.1 hypothetical protein GGTG_13356 [Gaeumannomyces tritici R3-111a-1]
MPTRPSSRRLTRSQRREESPPPASPSPTASDVSFDEETPALQSSHVTLGTSLPPTPVPAFNDPFDSDPGDAFEPSLEPSDEEIETDDDTNVIPASQPASQVSLPASQRAQKRGKGFVWSGAQIVRFLQVLAGMGRAGQLDPRISNWQRKAFSKAERKLRRQWPSISWKGKVKSKYMYLKKRYREWEGFGKRSGVSVDPDTGRYIASRNCFEAYFQVNSAARWILKGPPEHLDLCRAVFDGNWASGDLATTAGGRLRDQGLARPLPEAEQDPFESESNDSADGAGGAFAGPVATPAGPPQALTVARAQYYVGESLREAARTLAGQPCPATPGSSGTSPTSSAGTSRGAPSPYYLRSLEKWVEASKTLNKAPWKERLVARDRCKLISAFKADTGIAVWWLSLEEDRELIWEFVRGDSMSAMLG